MGDHPTLLIVDDSRTSRMIIKRIITQLRPGWALLEASSGDEALAKVAEVSPPFISMDMNMPGINGLDAAREIRQSHAGIRIVLCTANIQDSVQSDAAEAGLLFVSKPITDASVEKMISFYEG